MPSPAPSSCGSLVSAGKKTENVGITQWVQSQSRLPETLSQKYTYKSPEESAALRTLWPALHTQGAAAFV